MLDLASKRRSTPPWHPPLSYSIATYKVLILCYALQNLALDAARLDNTHEVFNYVDMQALRTSHRSGARRETVASKHLGLVLLYNSIGIHLCSTSWTKDAIQSTVASALHTFPNGVHLQGRIEAAGL